MDWENFSKYDFSYFWLFESIFLSSLWLLTLKKTKSSVEAGVGYSEANSNVIYILYVWLLKQNAVVVI